MNGRARDGKGNDSSRRLAAHGPKGDDERARIPSPPLPFKQGLFQFATPPIPPDACFANHTVTRNENRENILAARPGYGSSMRGARNNFGNVTVGPGFASRDVSERLPNLPLISGARQSQERQ